MKRKNIFRISIAFLAAMSFISCSDQFMQDKQNYDSTTTDAYNYWSGALARVADVYKNRSISVYFDGERVSSRKKRVLAPGEMEQVILTKESLEKYPDLKEITICTEVDE